MRNTGGPESGAWAALVRTHRQAARLDQVAFARRVGVDRGTVRRWETGTYLPRRPEVVRRVAELFGVDLNSALRAAGLLPPALGDETEVAPTPAMRIDPDVMELQRILDDPGTPEETRERIRSMVRVLRDLAEATAPRRRQTG